jgi:2-hydroxy-3-oxopropionate reductase
MNVFKRRLGLVGLGRMGGGVSLRLAKRAKNLMLFDISEEKRRRHPLGRLMARSMEDLLRHSDVLLLSLPGSPEVEDVVGRYLEKDVGGKGVIDLSTSYPPSSAELYERMTAAGGFFLDASLSGGPADAVKGTLRVLAGGDRETFDKCLPVFRTFAMEAFYVGKSGSGNIAKLASNFLSILYNNLYAEIIPFIEKLGVDTETFFRVISAGGANCGMFQLYAPKMMSQDFPVSFQLALAHKDLRYLQRLFRHEELPSPMLDAGLWLFDKAESMGLMERDTAELVRVNRRLYGMDGAEP